MLRGSGVSGEFFHILPFSFHAKTSWVGGIGTWLRCGTAGYTTILAKTSQEKALTAKAAPKQAKCEATKGRRRLTEDEKQGGQW